MAQDFFALRSGGRSLADARQGRQRSRAEKDKQETANLSAREYYCVYEKSPPYGILIVICNKTGATRV